MSIQTMTPCSLPLASLSLPPLYSGAICLSHSPSDAAGKRGRGRRWSWLLPPQVLTPNGVGMMRPLLYQWGDRPVTSSGANDGPGHAAYLVHSGCRAACFGGNTAPPCSPHTHPHNPQLPCLTLGRVALCSRGRDIASVPHG